VNLIYQSHDYAEDHDNGGNQNNQRASTHVFTSTRIGRKANRSALRWFRDCQAAACRVLAIADPSDRAIMSPMADRKLNIILKTPTIDFSGVVRVGDLVPLMSKHVPSISEMSDALSFLDPGVMGQGIYEGNGWSFQFTAVPPDAD
jgi:hypothetical protein